MWEKLELANSVAIKWKSVQV